MYERFRGLVAQDIAWLTGRTPAPQDERVRDGAMGAMMRHAPLAAFLRSAFPDHIRLSVHAASNAGPKFSIRLFEHSPECILPYHCVAVRTLDGRVLPMTRVQAEGLPGARLLRTEQGLPWGYEVGP